MSSATFTNTNIHFSNNLNNLYEYNSSNGTYNDPNGDSLVISGENYIFLNANSGFIFSNNNGTNSSGFTSGGCIYALGSTTCQVPCYGSNNYNPAGNGYYMSYNQSAGPLGVNGPFIPSWYNAPQSQTSYNFSGAGVCNGGDYSLVCANRILCTGEIDVASDKRIKQNINLLNDDDSLNTIRKLNPVKYNHKDYFKKGLYERFGFIAQDIKEILPSCVNQVTNFIPNIYENIEIIDKNKIKLINKSKEHFYFDNLKNEIPIRLKFFIYDKETNKETEKIYTLDRFIDDKIFQLNEEIEDGNIFFYGQEVNDFHVLNYDDINIINISAVKQLDNELQECKKIIDKQQSQIEFFMNEINILKNKIN